jgi:hypothetical protein
LNAVQIRRNVNTNLLDKTPFAVLDAKWNRTSLSPSEGVASVRSATENSTVIAKNKYN